MNGDYTGNISVKMKFDSTTLETFTRGKTSLQVTSEDEILGPSLVWTFFILRTLQGTVAMVLNSVTIFAVFKFDMLWKNSACRMVASLAFADFLGGVSPFFSRTRHFISSISLLNSMCYLQVIFTFLASYGNVYCTLMCTIDRYLFISRPLHYQSIVTPWRASVAILIVWMSIFIQITLILALAEVNAGVACIFVEVITKWAFYGTLAQFILITFCVIVPLYGVIGYMSWKASKNEPHITNYPPEAQPKQKKKLQERHMVKTVALVLGTYVACYVPLLTCSFIINFLYTQPFPFEILLLRRILTFVYYMQGILNTFIYSWKNVHFKQAYKKLLSKTGQITPMQ